MKTQGSVFRVRGGVAVVVGLTIMATFISYNLLQGTINVGRLLQAMASSSEEPDSIFEIDSYLVWSQKCQIPNVSPFHESIRKLIFRIDPIICSFKPPLTFVNYTSQVERILTVNTSAALDYVPHPKNISCCYSVISRVNIPDENVYNKTADNYFKVDKCIFFEEEVKLNSEQEFVLVKCVNVANKNKEVYKNIHAVVQYKQAVKNKAAEVKTEENKHLNILLIGLDSMSRLNLLRTMPKTVKYLRRTGWVELQGYNKVGVNTLPNLAALTLGFTMDQLKQVCWKQRHKKFDDCPFIWKDFSRLNYITSFLEDTPTQSTFNYEKTGFVRPPTDFYMRPMLLAAEKLLPLKNRDYLPICLGPTLTTEHILRYITDFATVFKSALYFVLAWVNNFSHSNLNAPANMDGRVQDFFFQLEETGAFNTSLVIFLSDHGMRWGEIRETSVGWLEERLPFLYIWMPEWFRDKYQDAYNNLVTNKNRLTSTFDLHVTLRDILHKMKFLNASTTIEGCRGCPKCVSLFSEVPAERSCEDAGIPEEFCSCLKYRTIPKNSKIVKGIAMFVVSEINSRIRILSNGTNVCSELRFHQVINLKRQVATLHDDYIVMFDTLPGSAVFEATVGKTRSGHDSTSNFQMRGRVSRINSYGNQTDCVDDPELKLYCHCA